MSDYLVTGSELTSVANAIRTKGDTSSSLVFPDGFITAIGNISGGSSDFNTVEVTVIHSDPAAFSGWSFIQCTHAVQYTVYNGDCIAYKDGAFYDDLSILNGQPTTYTLYYKGNSATLYQTDYGKYVSSTGDVVYDESTRSFTVTGDCSITGYTDD